MTKARTTHPSMACLTIRRCLEKGKCKCAGKYGYKGGFQRWAGWGLINRRLCGDKYAAAIEETIQKVRGR